MNDMYRKEIVYDHETRDRFWSKVNKTDSCWLWTGAKMRRGYGAFQLGGGVRRANRIAYIMEYGSIPDEVFVCHHCDVPSCVRPDHLFLGTAQDNRDDCVRKGRDRAPINKNNGGYKLAPGSNAGEKNPRSKMNWSKVREIRLRYKSGNELLKNLAAEYGISFSTADKIVRYETWGDGTACIEKK